MSASNHDTSNPIKIVIIGTLDRTSPILDHLQRSSSFHRTRNVGIQTYVRGFTHALGGDHKLDITWCSSTERLSHYRLIEPTSVSADVFLLAPESPDDLRIMVRNIQNIISEKNPSHKNKIIVATKQADIKKASEMLSVACIEMPVGPNKKPICTVLKDYEYKTGISIDLAEVHQHLRNPTAPISDSLKEVLSMSSSRLDDTSSLTEDEARNADIILYQILAASRYLPLQQWLSNYEPLPMTVADVQEDIHIGTSFPKDLVEITMEYAYHAPKNAFFKNSSASSVNVDLMTAIEQYVMAVSKNEPSQGILSILPVIQKSMGSNGSPLTQNIIDDIKSLFSGKVGDKANNYLTLLLQTLLQQSISLSAQSFDSNQMTQATEHLNFAKYLIMDPATNYIYGTPTHKSQISFDEIKKIFFNSAGISLKTKIEECTPSQQLAVINFKTIESLPYLTPSSAMSKKP